MLVTKKLDTWAEFEELVQAEVHGTTRDTVIEPRIFRGQPDATWHLETTWERLFHPGMFVSFYHMMIHDILPELQTFTGRRWELTPEEAFVESWQDPSAFGRRDNRSYAYMAYLRHYGFPSPLLDWTNSPFIAAYFAFSDLMNKADFVAIYSLLCSVDVGTSGLRDGQIFPVPASSPDNKRHYLQQSVYTVCVKVGERGGVYFTSHEDSYQSGPNTGELITKYILPASQRGVALQSLEAYNINAYSLFGSEESLLASLSVRAYQAALISISRYGWPH